MRQRLDGERRPTSTDPRAQAGDAARPAAPFQQSPAELPRGVTSRREYPWDWIAIE